jgi:hypothetical protein
MLPGEPFEQEYMRELFDVREQAAMNENIWISEPP